ncbi:MAG: 3-phosphoshikimate 1-carboxyvinyltransferase [Bacteroidetes bacterium]|nr:3-phosphoshikimate 1-carboxyvinyltransferase [Bacteroidota bacterium]
MAQSKAGVLLPSGKLTGVVSAPPSKSVMQRVLAIVLLRNLSVTLYRAGHSEDDAVVMAILRQVGFTLEEREPGVLMIVAPEQRRVLNSVDFGASGLAARMLIPILALSSDTISLNASPALQLRPMPFLTGTLPMLGVSVQSADGLLPAVISGPMQIESIKIDGSGSSQFLTGLLLAYAQSTLKNDLQIEVERLVSKPYIDLTLRIMEDFGLPFPKNEDYRTFRFEKSKALKAAPRQYTIEGDWSATSMWLVAGAIGGRVTVTGLDAFSEQADKKILQALMDAGASLSIEADRVSCAAAPLRAFQFDATDCPDLFPALAVLACYAKGTTVIEGLHRLVHKESNRALTIQSELTKMGADIRFQDQLMLVTGRQLTAADLVAHQDHRIAMMCAVAALGASGTSSLQGAESVRKSYPEFFDELLRLRS